jgi:hypothetical protein
MLVSTRRRALENHDVLIDCPCTISLFGVLIVQTSSYYQSFPKDRTFQKASVRVVAHLYRKYFLISYSVSGGDPHVGTVLQPL